MNPNVTSTNFKRGSTFSRAGLFKLPSGVWTAACDVNTPSGKKVTSLSCTLTELATPDDKGNTHSLLIFGTALQTSAWPIEKLKSDIRFADASEVVMYTTTFTINVQESQTKV